MCVSKVPVIVCIAYMLLLAACIACALSFVAPFWVLYDVVPSGFGVSPVPWGKDVGSKGLWGVCDSKGQTCKWFWENDFELQNNYKTSHKICQGLFAGGLGLFLLMYLMLSPYICCRCCRSSYTLVPVAATFVLAAIVCITASLAIYGVFSSKDESTVVIPNGSQPVFYWAYWVGVGSLGLALISAMLLLRYSCTSYAYTGYSPASAQAV